MNDNITLFPTRIGIVVPGTPESDADPRNPNVQPCESPDAPHLTGDNFGPADAETLARLGLDPTRARAERERTKHELYGRLDCLEAEIKSIRHMLVDLLGDDPKGAA